jgi:hypothetical protein
LRHFDEGYGRGRDGECLYVLRGEGKAVALGGAEMGEERGGWSCMNFEKFAREEVGLAKMGLKVLRNSV